MKNPAREIMCIIILYRYITDNVLHMTVNCALYWCRFLSFVLSFKIQVTKHLLVVDLGVVGITRGAISQQKG